MSDPHDDYYARKQAHREEVIDWIGLWRELVDDAGSTFRRVLALLGLAFPGRQFGICRMAAPPLSG